MKPKLLYVTDAYCCWCYGFSKTMTQVAQEFGDQLDIHVVHGAMIPRDLPLQTLFSSFPDPVALHTRISDLSGQVFGEAYLDRLETLSRSNRVVNSLMPARAMQAMKALTDASEFQIFTEIQHAYYRHDLDLNQMSTYGRVASMLDADGSAFELAMAGPESQAAVELDLALVQRLGVRGFPALLLQDESGYTAVARGYTGFDEVRTVLNRVFELAGASAVGGGNSCNMDGCGCG